MDPNNPNRDKRSTPQCESVIVDLEFYYAQSPYQMHCTNERTSGKSVALQFLFPNTGEVPPFNTGMTTNLQNSILDPFINPVTEPGKLEELAKQRLTEGGWSVPKSTPFVPSLTKYRFYASSNAGQSYTHLANRQAFYRHKIIPRQLVDTNLRDTSTTIFGHK
ncbi:MAG: hypothetical protein LQ338_006639, partial [Usnochroma carphineum]